MVWAGGSDEYATQVLVEIETDTGLNGVGECTAAVSVPAVDAAARHFADMLIGERVADLLERPPSWYARGRWQYFRPLANYAICGLEMALWDIAGKAASLPVCTLLGAPARDHVNHFCWLHRGSSLQDLLAQASQGLANGRDVFYVKIGINESVTEVISLVTMLREALGSTPALRVDANQAWSSCDAHSVLEGIADCQVDWIEEPVRDASVDDYRRIREHFGVRVAVDQAAWLPESMLELAAEHAIDVVCTDPSRVGGLAEFVRVGRALAERGVEVCRHCGNEFGVFLAASLHACAILSNLSSGNQYCDQVSQDIIAESLETPSGKMSVPKESGLGVGLNRDAVAAARDCYERVFAA